MTRTSRAEPGLWRYVAGGVGGAVMLLLLALAALVIVVPALTGSVPLTVLSRSMEPHLPIGTLVVVRPTAADDVRIGDVITFQPVAGRPELITHRVVAVTMSTSGEVTFTTKGDNNASVDDGAVTAAQVKGEVWYAIPWIGFVNSAVGQNRSWLVIAGAIVLFAYAGWMFVGGVFLDRRRRDRRPSPEEARP